MRCRLCGGGGPLNPVNRLGGDGKQRTCVRCEPPERRASTNRKAKAEDETLTDQLLSITRLYQSGFLTSEEFEAAKRRLLGL